MRSGKLPAGRARPGVGKRRHIGVVEVRSAPDFKFVFGEHHGLINVETDYVNVGNLRKPATTVDRIRCQWVVIAG